MTTKEQERKALAQIRKIVEGLGSDSYVATALEGCFEIAESNIENDWACSMKQRAESAEKKVSTLELDNKDLRLVIKKTKEEASKKQTELEEKIVDLGSRVLDGDDLTDCRLMVDNEAYEAEKEMKAAALEIVTFADDPASTNFQEAVRTHRNAQSRWNYLLSLKGRIEKAMGARV